MSSLMNIIQPIEVVCGKMRAPNYPPHLYREKRDIQQLLDDLFTAEEFATSHSATLAWLEAYAKDNRSRDVWVKKLVTLCRNVSRYLREVLKAVDVLKLWAAGVQCLDPPSTPHTVLYSALDYVMKAFEEFFVISRDKDDFYKQHDNIRTCFFRYLEKCCKCVILLMKVESKPSQGDYFDMWKNDLGQILRDTKGNYSFEFDLRVDSVRDKIVAAGNPMLNAVIPPCGQPYPPTYFPHIVQDGPIFVPRKAPYGRRLIRRQPKTGPSD